MKDARQAQGSLDLSVNELTPIDLSIGELERIAAPDFGDFVTSASAGAAVGTIFVGTLAIT